MATEENMYNLFAKIHINCKKSSPAQISNYQLSLELYKWYIQCQRNGHFSMNMISGGRQTNFLMLKNNHTKLGLNSLVNKFHVLNNKINLCYFNLSASCCKNVMKNIFKPFE